MPGGLGIPPILLNNGCAPARAARPADMCAEWARTGECTRNPDFMVNTCRKSCNKCLPA